MPATDPGTFNYDADDRLMNESYDANGNVLATGGKAFSYDAENHLIAMNGGAVTLLYDGEGNRVAKAANGMTTRYLVDDLTPTGYPQVVEETVAGSVTRQYTYGLERISERQPINGAWTPSFYGYDGGGNVRYFTNASGTITDTNTYDAFGNLLSFAGTTPNSYLYRGEQYDSDLGLYYLRARYYSPATGRFMSRDPEDGKKKIPATLHKYLYALGDPVNRIDPRGREAMLQFLFTTAVISSPVTAFEYGLALGVTAAYTCYADAIYELVNWELTSHADSPLDIPCLALLVGGGA